MFEALTDAMPGYTFHITEGPETQEILVGVRSGISAFFTQKIEFKSGNKYLRPGALLTVTIDAKHYPILFLHTKSTTDPLGLGLRDDMFYKAVKFRRTLQKASPTNDPVNYMFLGDLNTMGMEYPYDNDIVASDELRRLDGRARSAAALQTAEAWLKTQPTERKAVS